MNEKLKKLIDSAKGLWTKWSIVQKIILFGIIAAVVVVLGFVTRISAAPTTVPLFDVAITDTVARDNILFRLSEENVEAHVSSDGKISVADQATARRMRSILVREDLVPNNVDPWALFDVERWTTTDFERNVNLQRSITQMVTQHIEALDYVDDANVTLTMPYKALFAADQNPTTASVIITPKPGSDITSNYKKILLILNFLILFL